MVAKILICIAKIVHVSQVNYARRDAVAVLLKSLANQMRAPWIDPLVQVKRHEKDEVFHLTTHSVAKFSILMILTQNIATSQDKSERPANRTR
jgi:hypothetical protein